jgi:cytoskeletal protein CcmA (bactofilin family)
MLRGYLGIPAGAGKGEVPTVTDVANKTAEVEKITLGSGNGKPEERLTVLAAGDSLHGRLAIQGDGQLLGDFQGEVDCEGELLIGKDAKVAANIRTRNIVISGLVRGNVTAIGRLRIAASGRLEGDARVGALIVQEGGVHHGAIRVHPEGVPADEEPAAVETRPATPAEPQAARIQVSVDRVKKLWGEFF